MTRYLCDRMPSEVWLSLLSMLRQETFQGEKTKQQEKWIVFSQTIFVPEGPFLISSSKGVNTLNIIEIVPAIGSQLLQ